MNLASVRKVEPAKVKLGTVLGLSCSFRRIVVNKGVRNVAVHGMAKGATEEIGEPHLRGSINAYRFCSSLGHLAL